VKETVAKIELINVCKSFAARKPGLSAWRPGNSTGRRRAFAIHNLNLTIPHGKTMVILGPSGCGKSTLLRLIAGLIPLDAGMIRYDGVDMRDIPPGQRRIGMLFQSYALYPHMTAKTNILSYFIFRKKTPELTAEARARYQRTSELLGVEITYLQNRMPPTLSGGERQRVALGRCITRDPALFLLDEPFSNLDQKLREKYRVNLKSLLNQFDITTVYVTHDQHEAMILADYIAIMDIGTIEQVGTYEDIYDRPKNIFIAEFLNPNADTPPINLLDGARVAAGLAEMRVGVRPEDVEVTREESARSICGTIKNYIRLPVQRLTILTVRVGESEIGARAPINETWALNDVVWLRLQRYHVFDKAGQRVNTVVAGRL
jgi:ABC-type sugar transport system ATPase subunit